MGLDKIKKTPCGFCFVEFYTQHDARNACNWIQRVDERLVKVDPDPGFVEGRQYGRGMSGGQARDEARHTYDRGRGGYSALYRQRGDRDRRSPDSSRRRRHDSDDDEEEDHQRGSGSKRLREEDAPLPTHVADLEEDRAKKSRLEEPGGDGNGNQDDDEKGGGEGGGGGTGDV